MLRRRSSRSTGPGADRGRCAARAGARGNGRGWPSTCSPRRVLPRRVACLLGGVREQPGHLRGGIALSLLDLGVGSRYGASATSARSLCSAMVPAGRGLGVQPLTLGGGFGRRAARRSAADSASSRDARPRLGVEPSAGGGSGERGLLGAGLRERLLPAPRQRCAGARRSRPSAAEQLLGLRLPTAGFLGIRSASAWAAARVRAAASAAPLRMVRPPRERSRAGSPRRSGPPAGSA